MRIGIDISQLAFEKTGVAAFLGKLVETLVKEDKDNSYVLFYASLRKKLPISHFQFLHTAADARIQIKTFRFPPTFLDFLWNKLHVLPIEWLIGDVDVFVSSDWVQPPSKAKKVTILYDLIVYKYPEETAKKIVAVHKRRLQWVKKEVDKILCISEATRQDAKEILGIDEKRLEVVYPGV